MNNPLLNKGYSHLGQLGILLGLIGIGLVAGSFVSMGVWTGMTGQGMATMLTDMQQPRFANAAKVVQLMGTLFGFFLPAVAYAFVCFRNGWQALGFANNWSWKLMGLSLLLILCSGPLIDALTTINKAIPISKGMRSYFDTMEQNYEKQVKAIADIRNGGQLLMSLLMLALLPAVFEEVLFRGGLQNLLLRWWKQPWVAIVATSVLFSAIHGSWYGFLPRMVLGMLLGGIFYYTRNIWYAILVHFANNAMVTIYMYYLHAQQKPVTLANESSLPLWAGAVSLVLVLLIVQLLRKTSQQLVPADMYYQRINFAKESDTVA
ncbi:CPBP family intramembrane glutamic endopeptidase [Phnomibacter sp. MR]|uniref:CPBP family intramembrane glutamic endopeptidase n=1 Tax=Phnomibacter sp. MR TaxID=3042318 RepID=UPI003A808B2A